MILVESIKYYEVEQDPHAMIYMQNPYESVLVNTEHGEDIVTRETLVELCYGRRFHRPSDNAEILIGWSKDVQDLLGMPMEVWDRQEKDRNQLIAENNRFKRASFWQRFKWLFTCVK